MKPIIEVKNLGKRYNLVHARGGYVALRDVIATVARSPFAFVKSKARQLGRTASQEEFWALRDLSFSLERGEVLGIIGPNGAGKSTLLKILSQITPPTKGEITLRGRIGSLLEVGTGFHPELSGRENIFLNGAILGMSRREIAAKFDRIVDFAGIERFLDTPVKYYSSGMYVRLAFSVAAHLEPDILVVDEVLAVGDAEFQKKCLGKMDEITKEDGRTILFVSHNMGAIQSLCAKSLLLHQGNIAYLGDTKTAVEKYLETTALPLDRPIADRTDRRGTGHLTFSNFSAKSLDGKEHLETGKPFKVRLELTKAIAENLENVGLSFSFKDPVSGNNLLVFWTETSGSNLTIIDHRTILECEVKYCPLVHGYYYVNLYCTINGVTSDYLLDAARVSVDDREYFAHGRRDHESHPKYVVDHEWQVRQSP